MKASQDADFCELSDEQQSRCYLCTLKISTRRHRVIVLTSQCQEKFQMKRKLFLCFSESTYILLVVIYALEVLIAETQQNSLV